MANSISQLHESAETAGIDTWREHSGDGLHVQLNRKQLFRDPLKNTRFRTLDIVAVYGFSLEEGEASLVYIWEENFKSLKWRETGSLSRKGLSESFLQFGSLLTRVHDQNPSMKNIVNFFDGQVLPKPVSEKSLFSGLNLYWCAFGEMKFACLYREEANRKSVTTVTHRSSSALLECLSFHHDYFHYRSPIWRAVPMRFLSQIANGDNGDLAQIHLHPKTFDPDVGFQPGQFLWPWQKCIVRTVDALKIEYSPIETTSLVFDLRKSTIAMEQLPPSKLGSYSPFINEIVETAIEIVFAHGGFFDKETGDGLVAHFLDFSDLMSDGTADKPDVRAFEAALNIVRATSEICERFQYSLNFGIENLGGAVGLHSGRAVWVSELNQVRAIGDSVVIASRLANEADTHGIFVSNAFYKTLSSSIADNVTRKFQRKFYLGKEYKGGAGLYGHEVIIGDGF